MESAVVYYPVDGGILSRRLVEVVRELCQAYGDERDTVLAYQAEWNQAYTIAIQSGDSASAADKIAKVTAHSLWAEVEEVRTAIRVLVEERDLIRTLLNRDPDATG